MDSSNVYSIQLQVEYHKQMEQVWVALIPQLEGVQ